MSKQNSKFTDCITRIGESDFSPPHITLYSDKGAFIDGCCGILEYTPDSVRLNCKKILVVFSGDNLQIRADSIEQISVSGKIFNVSFCNM